ncbi:MAG: hypothetical protein LBR15_05060 [Methanobrevibacter sp.]|jgi:tetratricopeptide (TPR) repeat protein|nr:hypothetical protein [Candidatus Methanovirga australis]
MNNYKDSLIYFDKALKMNPKNDNNYINKALALNGLGKYNQAISYLIKP